MGMGFQTLIETTTTIMATMVTTTTATVIMPSAIAISASMQIHLNPLWFAFDLCTIKFKSDSKF
jgi:hypothetical protein